MKLSLGRALAPALALAIIGLNLASCGGSSSSTVTTCDGSCVSNNQLTIDDVKQVLAQAISEANARGADATIAVSDRVGNILAVYRMNKTAEHKVLIATTLDTNGNAVIDSGLEGISLPSLSAAVKIDDQAAIAKAVTGAYLSSEGNAFSSRTASQIVQEHFNPGELFQGAGPLFGVQFSQLACSDFIRKFNNIAVDAGPKRSPLGLAADPGGFPLYKNGTVVGGVGVMADGLYSLDPLISDSDQNLDELIALAATYGFTPPADRRADQITVDGKTLRFSDANFSDLATNPAQAASFDSLDSAAHELLAVPGYSNASISAGTVFTQAASGIRAATGTFAALDGFVFVDENNLERFPPTAGSDGASALSATEVETILAEALKVANHARAQIRRPLNTVARVTISVVDSQGHILGVLRSRDAPVFGADVSVQKARTAAFFSSNQAATLISQLPPTRYLDTNQSTVVIKASVTPSDYTQAARDFLAKPTALADGAFAFSDRAGGNLSRPYFPDGIDTENHGPFSKAAGSWSVFSTGFQSDVVMNGILQHVLATAGAGVPDVGSGCGGIALASDLTPSPSALATPNLANGIQIFPGSVPIYRGNTLVGGIGVSGDGVDQDDMISFLGLYNAGQALSGSINLPPAAMRADQLTPQGIRLRFVQCPQAPFVDSDQQTPCAGL